MRPKPRLEPRYGNAQEVMEFQPKVGHQWDENAGKAWQVCKINCSGLEFILTQESGCITMWIGRG